MSLLTEMRDFVRPGRTSVVQADGGMPGMEMVPMCVEVRVPESGSSTVTGDGVGWRLLSWLVGAE